LVQVLVARLIYEVALEKSDRCALLPHNSAQWVAMDLAIMPKG